MPRTPSPLRRLRGNPLRAVALLLLAAAGCRQQAVSPRNLVIVCIDTLRADHVGAYGYARETTPFVDELARRGSLFDMVSAQSNWTVPSTATILTGRYPTEHGAGIAGDVRRLGEGTPILQIRPDVETLASRLRDAGIRGALLSANPFLFGAFGRGFEHVEVERRTATALTGAALSWLDGAAEGRFFLYLQYMDLHEPVQPPAPFAEHFPAASGTPRTADHAGWSYGHLRHASALDDPTFRDYRDHRIGLYDGALRYVDDEIRRLWGHLERLGIADDTLLVVTSDHGEEFWDHAAAESDDGDPRGFWGVGHGHSMYQELLRVPLIFHGPGVARDRRIDCDTRLLDLAPTVLELLALPPPAVTGRSQAAHIRAGTAPGACTPRPLVAESPAYGVDSQAVTWRGLKLIARGDASEMLFDLRTDPGEALDLRPARESEARALREILRRELASRPGSAPPALAIDEETKQQLKALGYLD